MQAAAQQIGQQLIILDVNSDRDIEAAFATFVERGADALFVSTSAFMISNRDAPRHTLPASFAARETVVAGGLITARRPPLGLLHHHRYLGR